MNVDINALITEVARLRDMNKSLIWRLAAASHVIGLCAERGKVSDEAVLLLMGEFEELIDREVDPCPK